jgi:hypothetical protein
MARQIVDLQGLTERFPWTTNQVYKLVRGSNPIPHRKLGKRLLFDLERVYVWFDRLPGSDGEGGGVP